MTREEAISELVRHKQEAQNDFGWNTTLQSAFEMAIAALKAEPCDTLKLDGMLEDAYEHGYEQARHDFEVQPCEDCVSRADTLQSFESYCENNCQYSKKQRDVMCGACMMGDAIEIVENLPPVTPKQRTGKWIRHTRVENVYDIAGVKTWGIKHQCDQCTFTTIAIEGFGYYDYCPHCGAKMEGESE